MGFDLSGKGGAVSYNGSTWADLLRLAEANGWEPAGTVLEDDPDWGGYYGSNDFQRVTDEDAHAIATDALTGPVRAALGFPPVVNEMKRMLIANCSAKFT